MRTRIDRAIRLLPGLLLALGLAGLLGADSAEAVGGSGRVIAHVEIGAGTGGFTGVLNSWDDFGSSVAPLGDLDGDGISELAVGSGSWQTFGSPSGGRIWILFLNPDGTVRASQEIAEQVGGFTGALDPGDSFGTALAPLGDLDGDGVMDLAVGAMFTGDEYPSPGALWILFLNADGTVKAHRKIDAAALGYVGTTGAFGFSATALGDLDGDGVTELAVGAAYDYDGHGYQTGAVWIVFLHADGTVERAQKISATQGGFTGVLTSYDEFGSGVAPLGDVDGDGVADLAVSAMHDEDGEPFTGAVWILLLRPDGTVKSHRKISALVGGFRGEIVGSNHFGNTLGEVGDLDADGVRDLAVGHYTGGEFGDGGEGAVWILFLNPDGSVRAHQQISDSWGVLSGAPFPGSHFGRSVSRVGDLDGNGVVDLAVGNAGTKVWVLFMEAGPVETEPVAQDRGRQRCIKDMNRFGVGLAKQQSRVNAACWKAAAAGQVERLGVPPQEQDVEACFGNDVRIKVAKATQRLLEGEQDRCPATALPDYGYRPSAEVIPAMKSSSIALTEDLFGSDLVGAVLPRAPGSDGAVCQAKVLERTQGVFEALWTLARTGTTEALRDMDGSPVRSRVELEQEVVAYVDADGKGRTQRAVVRLQEAVLVKCSTTPIPTAFPGVCAAAASWSELVDCAAERARCRVCESLNALDGMAVDCNAFFDGDADSNDSLSVSCP